ncbi:MAG: AAA family ATPase [Planctomycetes bacterium]|nr:AAA family ATPase [Planctomycetota bacterium]
MARFYSIPFRHGSTHGHDRAVIIPVMVGAKIAIGGKGGVGKTTVCAVWAELFAEDGSDVLAIDADPNTNLASAFGIPGEQSPDPLIGMKDLIAERTGTGKEAVGAYFRLNPKVSDLPEKYSLDVGKLKLLVVGAITHGGGGCACPEGAFLKALLTHTILQRQEVVLVDLAAGVEFMGRASVQGIDALVLVVEPGGRSIETANNMAKMAGELGIGCVGAIANKTTDTAQGELIQSQLKDIAFLGSLPYSRALQEADLRREPVFEANAEIVEELKRARNTLMELVLPSRALRANE